MHYGLGLPNFDWQRWVERWERMQEHYLYARAERFALIARMIGATQPQVRRILDLGCGPGSLSAFLLKAFPEADVIGLDFDPAILALAQASLAAFGQRAVIQRADLRTPNWSASISEPCDAVVSATALHWLSADKLTDVYRQVALVLRPGGIFLNADHVGSDSPLIQEAFDRERSAWILQQGDVNADDWKGFWEAYGKELGIDMERMHQETEGTRERGVEQGLPLAWHFHYMKANGIVATDCFWRHAGDAVYGGIKDKVIG